MNNIKSRFCSALSLLVILFVPFPTALTKTVGQETNMSVHFLPASLIQENNIDIRFFEKETSSDILLSESESALESESESALDSESESESESESNLPCNWEWWTYNNPNCIPQKPYFDGIAASDTKQNFDKRTQSYRKVCVSYVLDDEASQSRKPHVGSA